MANPIVITDATFVLNSVDHSSSVKSVTLNLSADVHDVSAMTSAGWKSNLPGLIGGTIDVELFNDYDALKVDASLWTAFTGGAAVAFTTKATSAATSSTNPEYQGSCIVNATSPGGSINSPAELSVSFPITGAVTRATS